MAKEFDSFIHAMLPTDTWKARAADVKRAYFLLRDRNAHPDWLFEESGRFNDEYREEAYRALQLLGQFYGYVILRMAGIMELEPKFVRC